MFSSTIFAAAAAATMLGLAAAQSSDCFYCTQQGPFKLQLETSNATLNGQQLASYHSGAAIEQLGLGGNNGSNYYFNTSATAPTNGYPHTGLVTWNLVYNEGTGVESEPLNFDYSPFSNVASLVFEPSQGEASFAFTNDSYLAASKSIDDTVVPAAYISPPQLVQNFFMCQTYYGGYRYNALTWVVGLDAPQNPSCQSVKVKRVAV